MQSWEKDNDINRPLSSSIWFVCLNTDKTVNIYNSKNQRRAIIAIQKKNISSMLGNELGKKNLSMIYFSYRQRKRLFYILSKNFLKKYRSIIDEHF